MTGSSSTQRFKDSLWEITLTNDSKGRSDLGARAAFDNGFTAVITCKEREHRRIADTYVEVRAPNGLLVHPHHRHFHELDERVTVLSLAARYMEHIKRTIESNPEGYIAKELLYPS